LDFGSSIFSATLTARALTNGQILPWEISWRMSQMVMSGRSMIA
jgi:hypothetical protein